jgi:hypothetical protein
LHARLQRLGLDLQTLLREPTTDTGNDTKEQA